MLRQLIVLLVGLAFGVQASAQDLTLEPDGQAKAKPAEEAPVIIWASAPVLPGEIVMLYGGLWGPQPTLALQALADGDAGTPPAAAGAAGEGAWRSIEPLKITETLVAFKVPTDLPGRLWRCRVSNAAGQAETILNEPVAWWLHGDWGREASPGGWLRAFGRCLSMGDAARVILRGAAGDVALTPTAQSSWNVDVAIPADLAAGDYRVYLHNGDGSTAGWRDLGALTIRPHEEVWKADRFDVTAYGAIANDRMGDTPGVVAAIAAAAANGGGTVYFPRGRYQITETLDLPPGVCLQGQSRELSQLYWPDVEVPLEALIRGSHSFGVQDLSIHGGNYKTGIVGDLLLDGGMGHITLRRLRMRLLHDQYVTDEAFMSREKAASYAIQVGGEFVRVTDCDIYVSGSKVIGVNGEYMEVARNVFRGGSNGLSGSKQVIWEHNTGSGGGHSLSPNPDWLKNVSFSHNTMDRNFVHDREVMTFDGGAIAFKGNLRSMEGLRMNLDKEGGAWRHGADNWVGNPVMVFTGRGTGQVRTISAIGSDWIEVDRAWDIQPDKTSMILIANCRERVLMVDNHIDDATVALQLYGSMIESVLADNTTSRTGGFHNYGMWKSGPEPSWFVQYFDNQILEGNAYRGPQNEIPVMDAHMAIRDRGYTRTDYSFTRCNVMRRSILHSNALIEVLGGGIVSGALIENCLVKQADVGINIESRVEDVILAGNRFEDVLQPYSGDFSDVMTFPADDLAAAISGAKANLAPDEVPADWVPILVELDALAKQPRAAQLPVARQLALRAVRAFATGHQGTVKLAMVQNLLGIRVDPAYGTFRRDLKQGKTDTRLLVNFVASAWSPLCTATLTPGAFKGWQIAGGDPAGITREEGGRAFINFKLGAPLAGVFSLPVQLKLVSDDWSLASSFNVSHDTVDITDWLVVGPFAKVSKETIDSYVHPPEIKQDATQSYETRTGTTPWTPMRVAERGQLNLGQAYGEHADDSVAYAVAILRCDRPVYVQFAYTGMTGGDGLILEVNGAQVGTQFRGGQWGSVQLHKGDNVVRAISSNLDRDWTFGVKVTAQTALPPEALAIVPADALMACPALRPAAAATAATGRALPNSHDIDWQLIYDDDFTRLRLGSLWEGRADAHWRSGELLLKDGAMTVKDSWTALVYAKPVTLPLRVEYDVITHSNESARILGSFICPPGKSRHRFWKTMYGYGYFMSLGWHDRRSNSIMRNDVEILIDESGVQLEKDRSYHVTAQFLEDSCELYLDGKKVLEYRDPEPLKGLTEVGLYSFPEHEFDNIRIYQVAAPKD